MSSVVRTPPPTVRGMKQVSAVRSMTSTMAARPSDAVAVAVRTGEPLFVADDLMDAEGIMLAVDEDEDEDDGSDEDAPPEEVGNPEEIVGEFRSFLDSIRPEDFSS